jgi:hypothetical protein
MRVEARPAGLFQPVAEFGKGFPIAGLKQSSL